LVLSPQKQSVNIQRLTASKIARRDVTSEIPKLTTILKPNKQIKILLSFPFAYAQMIILEKKTIPKRKQKHSMTPPPKKYEL